MLSWNDPVISKVGAAVCAAGAGWEGRAGAAAGAWASRDCCCSMRRCSMLIPIRTPSARRRSGTTPYRVSALIGFLGMRRVGGGVIGALVWGGGAPTIAFIPGRCNPAGSGGVVQEG